ncbi:bifunctional metallophosphatase/5'-nucleotidase [Pseudonocardiaceae bacterium YIM PH 21723]|nr:bifunctional metallophosphatase/5'-nucleotidase [Pseudonocardiaceae bacterium YIM PH 21723]
MARTIRYASLAVAVLAALGLTLTETAQSATAAKASPKSVRLIGFNDFHGNLIPPAGSSGRVILSDGKTIDAGGAAYVATHVKQLRDQVNGDALLISGGDNISASPLVSALFHDEPTIEFMNDIGVDASAVGNHELDHGYDELQRMSDGGCHPKDGCQWRNPYPGARFPFLAANLSFKEGKDKAFDGYSIENVNGVKVGVIGLPLTGVPSLVDPNGIKDLKVADEVESINKAADELDRKGVKAIVVTIHQGDTPEGGGPNDCRISDGPLRQIALKASPKVDAFLTAHSHQQYVCKVNDPAGNERPVVQSLSYGRLLSTIDLKIDPRTKDVIRKETKAENHVVTRDVTPDPTVKALVDEATQKAAPIANKPIGSITAGLTRQQSAAGESTLGDVIADGQLASTPGAQLALMNPGGIRADIDFPTSPAGEGDGVVTYGEAFTVQPFGNILQTVTLTGAQLKAVLEQQWQVRNGITVYLPMQVSSTLHFSWTDAQPVGSRITAISINGVPVAPDAKFRVTASNFLISGGDGFTALSQGTDLSGAGSDIDAFAAYLAAHPNLVPPALDRVTKS